MIPAQELSFDLIPLFDAALWNFPDVQSQYISISDVLDLLLSAHLDC